MVKSTDLLNSLLVDTHAHPVVDKDTRFVIDPDTRLIINTATDELYLMQFDHNSETYTFQLPRYVEGHDMMLCNRVYVHFNNIDEIDGAENADVAAVYDLRVDPDNAGMVICSWTIQRQSTQLAGILSFLVQYQCVNDDGVTVYEWHTDIFNSVSVKSGRNNARAAVIEYSNIIEQWRERIFGVRDSVLTDIDSAADEKLREIADALEVQLSSIEAKGREVLETIPDDYTETYNNSNRALRTRANAIVNSTSGEDIIVDDCSDDHLRGLKVFGKSAQATTTGKNLFSTTLEYGLWDFGTKTKLVNNEYVKSAALIHVTPGATYIFSGNAIKSYQGNMSFYDSNKTYTGADKQIYVFGVFTVPDDVHYIAFHILADNVPNIKGTVQLELGDKATDYEPYSGGSVSPSPEWPQEIRNVVDPTVYVYGKNLLYCPTQTANSSEPYYYHTIKTDFEPVIGKTYTLSMNVNTNALPFAINVGCGDTAYNSDMNPKITQSYSNNGRISITFTWQPTATQIDSGYTKIFVRIPRYATPTSFNAVISDIMLELGDKATEYEPYVKSQSMLLNRNFAGIPVTSGGNSTDSNGQQWISDEIDLERGVYVQRVKTVMLSGSSSEGWTEYNNNASQGLSFVYWPGDGLNFFHSSICDKYRNIDGCWGEPYYGQTGIYSDHNAGSGRYFRPPNNTVTSVNDWRTWLAANPLTFMYVLAIPIETPLTDEEIYNFSLLHSNYPNTTVINNAEATMTLKYNADTAAYIAKYGGGATGAAVIRNKILVIG